MYVCLFLAYSFDSHLDPSTVAIGLPRAYKGTSQFGLIAEEVAKVNPDLVVRDHNGEIYSVRYEAVNAMLLNEFLKAHRKIQELEASNAQQQRNFAEQQKQIEALTEGLQKVKCTAGTKKARTENCSKRSVTSARSEVLRNRPAKS